jgi:diguanylate cyclase (GGDEF)-like protein/PAS domain S-box-containing protein
MGIGHPGDFVEDTSQRHGRTAVELELLRAELARDRAEHARAEAALVAATTAFHEREQALAVAEQLARVGSWAWHVGAAGVSWSEQVHRIFGTDPASPPPDFQTYVGMIHPDDRDAVLDLIRAAVHSGDPWEVEHRIVRTDGAVRSVASRGRAELDPAGSPVRLLGSIQDVTEPLAASRRLRESRDLFAGVLDAATEQSIIATDPDGLITVFNTGAERMLGYTAAEMIGTSPARLHDPAEIQARADELGVPAGFGVFLVRAAAGHPETRQWTNVTRDGRRLQVMITVTAMRDDSGAVTGYIKVGTDVTEQLRAQAALRDSEARLSDLFEYAPNGMMLLDLSPDRMGRFLRVNSAMAELTGYSRDQLLGMSVADLTHPEHIDAHRARFRALLEGRPTDYAAERHWVHADGHDLWVQFNVSPRRGGDASVVGQVEDITARKQAEARLTHQALHDGLTGLPNRLLLMNRIEHGAAACRRSGGHLGVLYLDLDGFKTVNDTGGHAVGDHVLVEVAHRLRRVVRPGDTVGRLGGDEFVVVCANLDDIDAATAIGERILAELRAPHVHAGQTFSVAASIGVALGGADSAPEQLLRDADAAMYDGKRAGKGRVAVSGAVDLTAMEDSARAARAVRVEAELRGALANGDLRMHGQTVHDLASGRITAVENLVRWEHPTRGLLGPNEFLDVAEAGELMLPLGQGFRSRRPGRARQHLRPPARGGQSDRRCADRAAPTRAARHPTGPGTHRDPHAAAGRLAAPRHRPAAGPRCPDRHRRPRHRLQQPHPDHPAPGRHPQGRHQLRRRNGGRPGLRRRRARSSRHRPGPRSLRRRRGGGDLGPGPSPPRLRMPDRPGVSLQPPAGRTRPAGAHPAHIPQRRHGQLSGRRHCRRSCRFRG